MNVYTIVPTTGEPEDVEADFYETDGSEYVFYAEGAETQRVPIAAVASVTKARKEPPPAEESVGLPLGLEGPSPERG
jgi:hypothetical protein